MPIGREQDLDAVPGQPAAEPTDPRIGQDERDADDDGRDRDRDVEGDRERPTAEELVLREHQRRADADDRVDRHRDQRHLGRELQGGDGVRLGHLAQKAWNPWPKALMKR
jgi:hypothetical protein